VIKRFVMSMAVATLLTACSSTPVPETRYYLLSSSDAQTRPVAAGEQQAVLGIAPVTVADYINTEGLALLSSENQLRIARHHRWAEKPEHALARTLQTDLSLMLDEIRIDNAQESSSRQWNVRLRLHVDQLHGTESGEAILSGFWRLDRPDTETVIASQRFLLRKSLPEPGYGAMVKSLRELVRELSQQLSEQIQAAGT